MDPHLRMPFPRRRVIGPIFATLTNYPTVATGFELGKCRDGISLRRFKDSLTVVRRLFEPRNFILLAERKSQSVNEKQLFAKRERRVVDNLSRRDRI